MTTASFILKYRRVDVKEVEEPQAVHYNTAGIRSEMILEEDIEVRGATTEKKGFTSRIYPHVLWKPFPVFCLEIF